ncbi:unnamed protein product [Trichobilharzia regenti]|nr:unnamed protein product [Trichobilharzia regenti]
MINKTVIFYPGLARSQSVPIKTYSSEVVTLWYRPPDVLLGDKNYSGHIDIWGVGCILYEMTTGYSLFPGTSKEDQVKIIFKKFGIPPDSYWPGLRNNSKFIEYFSPHQKDHPKASNFSKSSSDLRESNEKVIVLKQNKVDETSSMTVDEYNSHIMKKLSSCASRLNPEGLDLLFSCLALVGFRRITAFNALKHAYFQDILPSSINVHDLLPEQSIAFLAGEHIKSKFRSQFEYSRVKKDSITLSSAAAYGNKLNGYETLSKSLTNLNTNVPHLSNESKVSNSLAYIRQSVDQTSSKDSQPFQPIQSKEPQKSRQRRHHLYHTKRNANTTTQKNDSPKSCSLSDIDYSLSVCSDYDLVFHRNVKQRQPPPPHTTTSSSTTPPTTTTISLTSINKEVDLDKQTKLSNRKFRSISSVLGSKLLSYHRSSSSISSSGCSNSISSTASIRNQTTKSLKTSLKHKLSSFQSKTKGLRNRIKSSSHNQLIIERPSSAVPIITKSSQQTNLSYSGDVKSQNVNINSTRLHVDDDVITHGVEKNVTISKTCDIKSDQVS